MNKKDLISIKDLSSNEIEKIFTLTDNIKRSPGKYSNTLKGKSIGLLFQKPSNRTRVSFEVGAWQLGAHCTYLGSEEIKLGERESTKDVARTLSRYLDAVIARTFSHEDLMDLAKYATVPVINGLTDLLHPCQVLADIYTIRENKSKLKAVTVSYIGDGNNVCHSLIYGCAKMGINLNIATPLGYEPDSKILKNAKTFASKTGAKISVSNDIYIAVKDADIVYTDVWASMGQEEEAEAKKNIFRDYQINSKLLKSAKKDCLFMHCLPAHRGEEVTDEVIDSKNSIVFDQAENRLHVQKAILISLLKNKV